MLDCIKMQKEILIIYHLVFPQETRLPLPTMPYIFHSQSLARHSQLYVHSPLSSLCDLAFPVVWLHLLVLKDKQHMFCE